MQKWNWKTALKGNTLSLALIALGGLILFWIRDYKEVPSGIGPAFFPRIVAFMMIGLSLISLLFPDGKAPEKTTSQAKWSIAFTVAALLVMVAVMKYVHPMAGIVLFLGAYLKVIAKLDLMPWLAVTAGGSVLLYAVILALRIPM